MPLPLHLPPAVTIYPPSISERVQVFVFGGGHAVPHLMAALSLAPRL